LMEESLRQSLESLGVTRVLSSFHRCRHCGRLGSTQY
jgi:hypothetical protein